MPARRSLRHLLTIVLSTLVGLLIAPGLAEAHTDFDYSLPTDGASVGVPIDEITVAFTLPVTLVGNGFTVLDPQTNELEPFAVTDDDTVFRLQFDPPLAGGTVAVKYEVRAEDGHVLSGSFVFVVDAPVPTTVSPTVAPSTTRATVPSTTAPSSAAPTEVTTTTGAVATTTADPSTVPPSDAATGGDGGSGNGLAIGVAIAIALAAGGFVLVRSRTST